MDDPSARSPSEDEESSEFLCAVAAEAVTDAVLLLEGLDSAAELFLRRALGILEGEAATAPDSLDDPRKDRPLRRTKLSSTAIDLLIQQRQCEDHSLDFQDVPFRRKRARGSAHVGTLRPARQRAIMLMIEALSLLDQVDDLDAVSPLQLAIDRAVDCANREANGIELGQQERLTPH